MTPTKRMFKRIVIIAVYIILAFFIIFGIYYFFRTQPTCQDSKLNQGEEKADCGGPCKPCVEIPSIANIEILEKGIIASGANKYDAVVKLKNPNAVYGVAGFDYKFVILDGSGKILDEKSERSFVLPGETKYIFAFNLESSEKPASFDFRISSFKWTKFSEYQEPDVNIYAKEFNLVSSGAEFAQLKGKMKNQSDYDFKKITVKAVLRNGEGALIAINETNFNDVKTGEEREIFLNWADAFAVDPMSVKIEIEPEVNAFDSDNFMKKYGTQQQYESYEIK